ncbi:MAG: dihydroxyacetone kinase subunit DhaK [Spirochaetes bacterium]|nr:dihydroxyacetone kinase subunit DhaK [Spirochaetota bacterium]
MKKIINTPERVVDEMLEGIVRAYPGHLKIAPGTKRTVMLAGAPVKGKVAIITGGGSGHLPLFLGYTGQGLLDGTAVGDVFSSPSSNEIFTLSQAVHAGKGVLYLYGNYGGDILNFDMAAEMAEEEGIETATSIGTDDVASAPANEKEKRRGIAGILYAYKIAGAKAASGASLREVKKWTDRAIENTRTMGVALSSCTIPAAGEPTFSIGDDEMEIGMGIHGEKGVERGKLKSADEIAEIMTTIIIDDLPFKSGDEVSVLVNGLGATAPQELFILFRKVSMILADRKINIYKSFIGEYATSMEMKGASISLFKLDEGLKALLDAPCHSPFLLQQI